MDVNQWIVSRANHGLHSSQRLPPYDSDCGAKLGRAPLEGDEKTPFMRSLRYGSAETHGSAAPPTIHEGTDYSNDECR